MVRICFVCLGNICRSPTAEAVMKHLVRQAGLERSIHVESAGTGDWHIGETRDRRSLATGVARGIPLSGRAQQFTAADFARFDYVVAMDTSNRDNLLKMAPDDAARAKISMLRAHEGASGVGGSPAGAHRGKVWEPSEGSHQEEGAAGDADVPDPYYGGAHGFEDVFDICQAACAGFLARVRREHGL
jgi:protein-tyrosine phosphatase